MSTVRQILSACVVGVLVFASFASALSSVDSALCAFIAATNIGSLGKIGWTCNLGVARSPCGDVKAGLPLWSSLSCDSQGRVVTISLANNAIRGTLPSELGLLTTLRSLSIDSNRLSGNVPASLGSLTGLTQLKMDQNSFMGVLPAALGNLFQLTALILNGNRLSGTLPASLAQLKALVVLRLDSNYFSRRLPTALCALSAVNTIYLSTNVFTGKLPSCLGNDSSNPSLYSLSLGYNSFTGTIPAFSSRNLTIVDLSRNKFSGSVPDSLCALPIASASGSLLLMQNNYLVSCFADCLGAIIDTAATGIPSCSKSSDVEFSVILVCCAEMRMHIVLWR